MATDLSMHSPRQSRKKVYFFDALAFELRAMIFQHLDLTWRPSGLDSDHMPCLSMPNIIIALRPQPISYQHALAMFYERNAYALHKGNGHSFGWMLPKAIQSIRELTVHVVDTCIAPDGYTLVPFTPTMLLHTSAVRKMELRLDFERERLFQCATEDEFSSTFPKWLQYFKALKCLQVQIPVSFPKPWAHGYSSQRGKVYATTQDKVCRFDELVGGRGEFIGRSSRGVVLEDWRWTPTEEGGTMDWSKVPAEALEAHGAA